MICEFVDKILVHAPDRSMEDRTQEELVKMEKRRKRRAQYLEKTKRYAARKKQPAKDLSRGKIQKRMHI